MSQNDQLYSFLLEVYKQITPERVYPWIKADSKGRGVLRRADFAFGFTQEDGNKQKIYKEDENNYGFLRILKDTIDPDSKKKYSEAGNPSIDEIIKKVYQTCDAIKCVLSKYLIADYDACNQLQKNIFEQCFMTQDIVSNDVTTSFRGNLYRLREMKSTPKKRILDFFHVPFTERYLMGTYRYSIPGYPSLYTSSTVYGAWEEMDRKDITKCGYMVFELKKDIQLLDLRWRFKDPELINDVAKLKNYILHLPIIIACSMQVRHSREKFVPEYIFPQQIFKWLMDQLQKHKTDFGTSTLGVAYTSNKPVVWEELCKCKINDKGEYREINYLKEVTNYALLAYLPIDGDFSKYSYKLGSILYAKYPYWLRKQPSAYESAYQSLCKIQNELNKLQPWYELGDVIMKEELQITNMDSMQMLKRLLRDKN